MAESSPNGVENTAGKGEIARLRAISPFPTVFSKDLYCRHVKTRACLGKGAYGILCQVHTSNETLIPLSPFINRPAWVAQW